MSAGSWQAQVEVGGDREVGRPQERAGPGGPQAFLFMLAAQLGASVVSSVKWGEGSFSFQSPNWTTWERTPSSQAL